MTRTGLEKNTFLIANQFNGLPNNLENPIKANGIRPIFPGYEAVASRKILHRSE